MRTPEQLRELSNELRTESESLKQIASSLEQWEAVRLLREASADLFSAAGDLDLHAEKYEVSRNT